MVRADDLIISGKGIIRWDHTAEKYTKLRELVIEYMRNNRYGRNEVINPFIGTNFYCLSFMCDPPVVTPSISQKIKRYLNLIHEDEYLQTQFLDGLRITRSDLPFSITVEISPVKRNDLDYYNLKVVSEPAILFKHRNLGYKLNLSDDDYNNIVRTNIRFIENFFAGFSATIIEEPKPLRWLYKTPIIDDLNIIGMKEVAELFESTRLKINKGNTDDAFVDLRTGIELLVKGVLNNIEEEFSNDFDKNLRILKDKRYLNKKMYDLTNKTIKWCRDYTSKVTHTREKLTYLDSLYVLDQVEILGKYMIERIIYKK